MPYKRHSLTYRFGTMRLCKAECKGPIVTAHDRVLCGIGSSSHLRERGHSLTSRERRNEAVRGLYSLEGVLSNIDGKQWRTVSFVDDIL